MKKLLALVCCMLLLHTANAKKIKPYFAPHIGIGLAKFSTSDSLLSKGAVGVFKIGAQFIFDADRVQFGFGVDGMVVLDKVFVFGRDYRDNPPSPIKINIGNGGYATPNVFLNYKFYRGEFMYAWVGASAGVALIPFDEVDGQVFRPAIEAGYATSIGDIVDLGIAPAWHIISQPGYEYREGDNTKWASSDFTIRSLSINLSIRIQLGRVAGRAKKVGGVKWLD